MTFTRSYGTDPGRLDPIGNDILGSDYVEISDESTARFADSFDLSGYVLSPSTTFQLTLEHSGINPETFFGFPVEDWDVRIQGDDNSSAADDLFLQLNKSQGATTSVFSLDSGTESGSGTSAFSQTLSSTTFAFWFAENTFLPDAFRLDSAQLTVANVSPVPIPPAALLFLSALAGAQMLRLRASQA